MILRAALACVLSAGCAVPAMAQDAHQGLTCASINALGPDAARAFFFGYEAGFVDFLDPEGHQTATTLATAVSAPPQGAADMASACQASPGIPVAQILANWHGNEDPIDLKQSFLQRP